jgi:hypothetical protein
MNYGGPEVGAPGWGHVYPEQFIEQPQELTSENLMMNATQEECDLLDPRNYAEGDMYLGLGHVKTEERLMPHAFPTSSSDKSSPSTSGGGVKDENKGLSEKEVANKRKAQNRAAQRAFRERKEMKLKELEDKLSRSETDRVELEKQLEELKKQNFAMATENKILQKAGGPAVGMSTSKEITNDGSFSFPGEEPLYGKFFQSEKQLTNPDIPYESKRLTLSELWEYLVEKDDPRIDVEEIMKKVKGLEVCHRHGPAYPLQLIDDIINEYMV